MKMKLTSHRALLRLMSLDDIDALYKIVESHPHIWTFLTSKMDQQEDMRNYVVTALNHYAQGTEFPFVVIDQSTGELVGSTRLYHLSNAHRSVELGYTWYHPKVQRTSINTECKYLLLHYAFEELDVLRVQLKTDARNLRAQQAIKRLGATKEGLLRHERPLPNGYVRDAVIYSILKEEWPQVKAHLQRKMNR
ncbi:RimJ/RimL family protein N-acetyltransferase [Pullulanibacillus pueri]|nr:RimJ/RimL family protein N-acetyltransferase [Pullulanibacillus pueri]